MLTHLAIAALLTFVILELAALLNPSVSRDPRAGGICSLAAKAHQTVQSDHAVQNEQAVQDAQDRSGAELTARATQDKQRAPPKPAFAPASTVVRFAPMREREPSYDRYNQVVDAFKTTLAVKRREPHYRPRPPAVEVASTANA